MRRRKRTLQPDNFPFLAVLLCTMGSLILVLLVLDQRARAVARSKAQQVWEKVAQEEAEDLARLQAEREQALADHLGRHEAEQQQLRHEQQQFEAQRTRVLGELETVRRSIQEEEDRQRAEKSRQASEASRAQDRGQALAAQQEQIAKSQRELDKASAEREKLTAYLLRLEQQLALLKKQREQSRDTWSVVPYAGKRGRKGRPLYVECAARGLIFHPDRFELSGFDATPEAIRDEVRRRSEAHIRSAPPDNPDAREAYWMLLVRPDGIERYYQMLAAVQGLEMASGYEFVDADWKLDFPDPSSVAIVPRPPVAVPAHNGHAGGNVPGGGGTASGGTQSGPVAVAPIPIGTLPRGGVEGSPETGTGGNGGAKLLVPRPQQPGHGGTEKGSESLSPKGGGTALAAPPLPRSEEPVGVRSSDTPPVANAEKKQSGTNGGGGSPGSQGGEPGSAGGNGSGGSAGDGPKGSPPRALKPASRFGDPELLIVVECGPKGIQVSPGRLDISLQDLTRGGQGAELLLKTVRETIARREAAVRPGEPPVRPSIRFVVQHDALRTFHLVYPVLDVLPVPKRTVLNEE